LIFSTKNKLLTDKTVDYNSWAETDSSRKAIADLDKDFIIAEGMHDQFQFQQTNGLIDGFIGYKEFKTHRRHMAVEGDWRKDKDLEMPLDGIGGVNILVKADVHRSGKLSSPQELKICCLR
jgi:hypothetical protein